MNIDEKWYCSRCLLEAEGDGVCAKCGFDARAEENPGFALPMDSIVAARYLVGAVLGMGGFGITYAAWDITLNIPVALKEYFPRTHARRDTRETDDVSEGNDESSHYVFHAGKDRFIREARALASLGGEERIVSIYNYFEENQTAYIAMEFIRGQSLKERMEARGGRLNAEEAFRLMRGPMEAMRVVHAAHILHRDISPSNLLLQEDGRVRLIDFGAAADYLPEDGNHTKTVMLRQGYAPPEQYQSHGAQGPWTDVYALCATLYHLITGVMPPPANERLKDDPLLPPNKLGAGLSRKKQRALLRGLAVRAENRTQDVEILMCELYGLPLPSRMRAHRRRVRAAYGLSALVALVCLLVTVNYTAGFPGGGGFYYRVGARGAGIARYTGGAESVRLPERALGLPVRAVLPGAFAGNAALRALEAPGSIEEIGDFAFSDCAQLSRAMLCEGVSRVGAFAFANCPLLREVSLPASAARIADSAFSGAGEALVIYGENASAAEAFCARLNLPFCVPGEFAYEIEGGAAVVTGYLGARARVVFPAALGGLPVVRIAQLVNADGNVILRNFSAWVPEGVREIGASAFSVSGLTQIRLPSTLEKIGDLAFSSCMLSEIEIPSGVTEIGYAAFFGANKLAEVSLPESLVKLGDSAFSSCAALSRAVLPDSLEDVPGSCFSNCRALSLVRLSARAKTIGVGAFGDCASLACVSIPEGVKTLGAEAFMGCASLSGVQFRGDACLSGAYEKQFDGCADDFTVYAETETAFAWARARGFAYEDAREWLAPETLSYTRLPSGVSVDGCESDGESWVFPVFLDGLPVKYIHTGGDTLRANPAQANVARVVIPRYAVEVGQFAFYGAPRLSSVSLPEGLLFLGMRAFSQCASLCEIALPESLRETDTKAFFGCESLAFVALPPGARVSADAFGNCPRLLYAYMPDGEDVNRQGYVSEQAFSGAKEGFTLAGGVKARELSEKIGASFLYRPNVCAGDTVSWGAQGCAWRVLALDGRRALLLACESAGDMPFDAGGGVSWRASSLRAWLNGEYLALAFTDAQRAALCETDVFALPGLGDFARKNDLFTRDRAFLLSLTEARAYAAPGDAFLLRSESMAEPGRAALAGGASVLPTDAAPVRPAVWVDLWLPGARDLRLVSNPHARADDVYQVFDLAVRHYGGNGVAQSYEKAAEYFLAAAEMGRSEAQCNLANMLIFGLGVSQNAAEAAKWYQIAAVNGDADAQNNLASLYRDGRGVPRNDALALKWYLLSAQNGHADAQNSLGVIYENGRGTEKNLSQAIYWYEKSAENGGAYARFNLGFLYLANADARDYEKARAWLTLAAGDGDAKAQYALGLMCENGLGAARDVNEAFRWYALAAENGSLNAQNALGYACLAGDPFAQSYENAAKYLGMAAAQGDKEACYFMGLLYEEGKGVSANTETALAFYARAAESGHAGAQLCLGYLYYEGRGVPQSYAEAYGWFEKAAAQGNADAIYNLRVMTINGQGAA